MSIELSIIIPCYRQSQYLEEALQSVLEQDFLNWECIIVNDGSPDDTEEIANKWIKKDKRFKYIYQENGGISSARNSGIQISKGEYILPLDADDKISKLYAKHALMAFSEDLGLKVVYCRDSRFGLEEGEWIRIDFSLLELSRTNMIICSAIFRKKDWELVGGYDTRMVNGWEDWEFWIAMLKDGGRVKCLDEIGFYYRIKQNSRSKDFNDIERVKMLEYLSKKHVEFFIEFFGSFHALNAKNKLLKMYFAKKITSKKYVLNMFSKTFFGIYLFKEYSSDTDMLDNNL